MAVRVADVTDGRMPDAQRCFFIVLFSDEKYYKVTFLLSYFCVTKSTKSQQGGLAPSSFRTTGGVHELVARAVRGECVRQRAELKSTMSCSPQSQLYHACEHSARESRADSCTHCLHARIIGLAGVNIASALTGWRVRFLFCLLAVLEF